MGYRDKKCPQNTASIDWQYGNFNYLKKNKTLQTKLIYKKKTLRRVIFFSSFVAKYRCVRDVMQKIKN